MSKELKVYYKNCSCKHPQIDKGSYDYDKYVYDVGKISISNGVMTYNGECGLCHRDIKNFKLDVSNNKQVMDLWQEVKNIDIEIKELKKKLSKIVIELKLGDGSSKKDCSHGYHNVILNNFCYDKWGRRNNVKCINCGGELCLLYEDYNVEKMKKAISLLEKIKYAQSQGKDGKRNMLLSEILFKLNMVNIFKPDSD